MKPSKRTEKALEKITSFNLRPGDLITVEQLEEIIGLKSGTVAFNFTISEIRNALFSEGKYLSGEGSAETGAYEIFDPIENQWVAKLFSDRVDRGMEGMVRLLQNTDRSAMTKAQVARHENTLRHMALKMHMLNRHNEVATVVKKHAPGLLKPAVELENLPK